MNNFLRTHQDPTGYLTLIHIILATYYIQERQQDFSWMYDRLIRMNNDIRKNVSCLLNEIKIKVV